MQKIWCFTLVSLLLLCSSCSSQQDFIKGEDIQSRARYVAVLPLINLTTYANAGRIVGDLLITELYAETDFAIIEQTDMLKKLKGTQDDLDQVMDKAVALSVGKLLGVDTVIYGSVTEYRYKRGLNEDPVVGINLRMLDVKTNQILWAGSRSSSGGCFWFCEDSLNRLAQDICHDLVTTMINE